MYVLRNFSHSDVNEDMKTSVRRNRFLCFAFFATYFLFLLPIFFNADAQNHHAHAQNYISRRGLARQGSFITSFL